MGFLDRRKVVQQHKINFTLCLLKINGQGAEPEFVHIHTADDLGGAHGLAISHGCKQTMRVRYVEERSGESAV